jgi:hypothetical protein
MLKINDKVKFHYLKQFKDELKSGQVLTDYTTTSESYSGKVVDVRNIIDQPVSNETIRRNNIKGRRSEVLYTVELEGDEGVKDLLRRSNGWHGSVASDQTRNLESDGFGLRSTETSNGVSRIGVQLKPSSHLRVTGLVGQFRIYAVWLTAHQFYIERCYREPMAM